MTALEQTLPILLIFLLGIVLKKRGILRKEDGRMLGRLILLVILPATILNALPSIVLSPSLFLLPLAAMLVEATLCGLSFVLAPLLGLEGKTRGAFLISFPTLEVGSIGYAFLAAAYGVRGLALTAIFELGDALFFFLVIPFLASVVGHPAKPFRAREVLRPLLINPLLWSYAVGIALNYFHLHLPLFSHLFAALSQALLLLVMLLIAIEFELSFARWTRPALAMYLKMALGVSLGLLLSLLLRLTGVEQRVVVLASSLPATLVTVVYAREHELDVPFLASMLSLALPTAIGFCFLLISLVH